MNVFLVREGIGCSPQREAKIKPVAQADVAQWVDWPGCLHEACFSFPWIDPRWQFLLGLAILPKPNFSAIPAWVQVVVQPTMVPPLYSENTPGVNQLRMM